MMLRMLLVLVAVLGLSLGGCKKEEPASPLDQVKEEAEKAADEAAPAVEEAAADAQKAVEEAQE